MSAETVLRWRSSLVGALTAAVLTSAADVWHTVAQASMFLRLDESGALLIGVLLVNLCVALLIVGLSRRWLPPWGGFWLSMAGFLVLFGGEWWFRDPPPHVHYSGSRGDLMPFLGALLVMGLCAWGLRWVWARRCAWGLLAMGLVWWMGSVVEEATVPHRTPVDAPNVVLVTVDTLRSDHIGAWGAEGVETPHVDALAASGVRFARASAPIAVTGPSHAAILSGAGPWTPQMLLNGVDVPPETPWLAERLRDAGYRTGAFVSAYVLDGSLGFSRGFEVYDSQFGRLRGFASTGPGRLVAMLERIMDPHLIVERPADQTVGRVLDWLDTDDDKPFFAWVHLFDPHGPYVPPPPWDSAYYTEDPYDPGHTSMDAVTEVAPYLQDSLRGIRDLDWVKAQYAGEVSFVDEQIGRLLNWIAESGHKQDTLIVFAGDHGESLGEEDVWFNHGGNLDASAIDVPLIMTWPGRLPSGVVVEEVVGVVDVAPTVMSLLGQPFATSDGVDLSGSWSQGEWSRPSVRSLCLDREKNQQERAAGRIESPTYLLARSWSEAGHVEIGTHAERGAKRRGWVDDADIAATAELLRAVTAVAHDKAASRDAASIERLKALGYVE